MLEQSKTTESLVPWRLVICYQSGNAAVEHKHVATAAKKCNYNIFDVFANEMKLFLYMHAYALY